MPSLVPIDQVVSGKVYEQRQLIRMTHFTLRCSPLTHASSQQSVYSSSLTKQVIKLKKFLLKKKLKLHRQKLIFLWFRLVVSAFTSVK